ncbi:MAG: ATP-dependent Clp protease adaptor ClpS [Bacteroidales bacterium]|nr:ATP-dependent Clp protease adaptor ClpS [Bacteroidales bacterium]MBN2819969.1 ATP-dependent Clp protease adaptor ClpS [Bacteroidales bacterium]
MSDKEYLKNKPDFQEFVDIDSEGGRCLILHNDEVHSFDYVIETLVKVFKMDSIQAEQCTYLVHYKGKCDVKKGSYDILKPYKEALIEKGLEATID